MEVQTEVPETGTRLHIDADRQFEGQPGDSTLRIAGERDGSPVFDATYVECSPSDAKLVGWLLRAIKSPSPDMLEKISQEVQATFSAKLGGKDAHQAADVMWHGLRVAARDIAGHRGGYDQYIETLAERFERASARANQPYAGTHTPTPNGG